MVLLRGIAEDVDFHTWLYDYIFPTEKRWVSEEFCRVGTELAICESIRNGVTYLAEMYFYEDAIADCLDKFGIRGMLGATVWDIEAPNFKTPEQGFKLAEKLAKQLRGHERLQASIAPHAPYTCSEKTLKDAANFARAQKIPAMIHMAETKVEFDDCLKNHKKTPMRFVNDTGLFDLDQVLLAHSVWVDEADYKLLSRPNLSVVLNPQCNAKLASGIPPAQKYLENGVRFTMGTDGAASNNNLDLFAEMNFLSKIHHVSTKDLKGLPGPIVFDAATRSAAEAVGLGEKLGSLEPGKQADFILIDASAPHLTPLTRAYSHLIYSVRGSDVETVYVAGRCLMKNRKILVADESKIIARANKLWSKIRSTVKSET
jgi:5-methylthioadenosine/S-adenosylhomocysteine deaminase